MDAEERAKAGARALSAWLMRCRTTVGVTKGKSCEVVEIIEVLLCGAEV